MSNTYASVISTTNKRSKSKQKTMPEKSREKKSNNQIMKTVKKNLESLCADIEND